MTATRIRCGVAGTGSLGQHHARIYSTLPGAELAGIFEPNDARAAEICAKHNCHRFATLDEMAAGCDAVSVVVPTNYHAALAIPLLLGMRQGTAIHFEAAVLIAMLGFVGTVALCKYVIRRDIIE